jgi:F0F1-type ATP synthase assembly protein I
MAPADDERRRVERSYLRYATTGVEFFATIAVLALLGLWLDGRFHIAPVLTIVLTFVGFAAATWNLLRSVDRYDPPKHDQGDAR